MRKYYFIRILMILVAVVYVKTGAQSIRFHVNDLCAGPADCNFMFDTDDPGFVTHDANAFTEPMIQTGYSNYAYRNFNWEDGRSEGTGSVENIGIIEGVGGLTIRLNGFSLKSFTHINTVDADQPWTIMGQAGDERIYGGGTGEIYLDGVLKLRVINCRLSVTTPYPTAAQLNAHPLVDGVLTDVGTGMPVTGSGWGEIDMIAGDPQWRAAFDPNGTGQVEYTLSTISQVIQDNYGWFDFDIEVGPTNFRENLNFAAIPAGEDPQVIDLPASDVSIDFNSALNDMGNVRNILANQILTPPAGTLPDNIEAVSQSYWHMGTTLKSFSCDVTFDISGMDGITDPSKLCILKRKNSSANWVKWADVTVAENGQTITANGVSSFSEFAIGSTASSNPLPVELTSLTAERSDGNTVMLRWQTATEINNLGFAVERKSGSGSFEKVVFVEGHGNSSSLHNYQYKDRLPDAESEVVYRLKQTDMDGRYKYSPEVMVSPAAASAFVLKQNYPNPANPSTKIRFSTGKAGPARLSVYDILGNEVKVLLDGMADKGEHEVTLDGRDMASGVYYYRLMSNGSVETRRLMILK